MPPKDGKVFPMQFHEVENKLGREEKVDGKVGSAWADGKQGDTGEIWVSTAGEQLHSCCQTQEIASRKKTLHVIHGMDLPPKKWQNHYVMTMLLTAVLNTII